MAAKDANGRVFEIDDLVVYPGQGLCRVVGAQDVAGKRFLMLELIERGMRLGLPEESVAATLQRPMGEADAEATFARLKRDDGEPDARSWPYRARDGYRTLARGPQSARVEHLHSLYRSPFAPTFAERKMIFAYEDAVLPELASSLGRSVDLLRETLHAIHPVFRKDAPQRPDEPPADPHFPAPPFEIPGFTYLGSFTVDRELVVGEPGATLSHADQPPDIDERHSVRVEVRPGHWLAFKQEEDGSPLGLVAVHEREGGKLLTLLHDSRDIAGVIIEGGRVAMLDAAVRTEAEFVDEMEFPLFAEGLIKERGATCTTGGDGVFPVVISRSGIETILVSVRFDND